MAVAAAGQCGGAPLSGGGLCVARVASASRSRIYTARRLYHSAGSCAAPNGAPRLEHHHRFANAEGAHRGGHAEGALSGRPSSLSVPARASLAMRCEPTASRPTEAVQSRAVETLCNPTGLRFEFSIQHCTMLQALQLGLGPIAAVGLPLLSSYASGVRNFGCGSSSFPFQLQFVLRRTLLG